MAELNYVLLKSLEFTIVL